MAGKRRDYNRIPMSCLECGFTTTQHMKRHLARAHKDKYPCSKDVDAAYNIIRENIKSKAAPKLSKVRDRNLKLSQKEKWPLLRRN